MKTSVISLSNGVPEPWREDIAGLLGLDDASALDEMNLQQILVATAVKRAIRDGDIHFAREILDRIAPKPRRLEISGPEGEPVDVRRIEADMDVAEAAQIYEAMRNG